MHAPGEPGGPGCVPQAGATRLARHPAGQAAGCFTVADAEIALCAVAGGLPGLLRLRERHPEQVDETSVDQLTGACLRLLGVPASEAARLVASGLPSIGAVSR
jgi:Tetracyclin repressor-like, C-terminal domain